MKSLVRKFSFIILGSMSFLPVYGAECSNWNSVTLRAGQITPDILVFSNTSDYRSSVYLEIKEKRYGINTSYPTATYDQCSLVTSTSSDADISRNITNLRTYCYGRRFGISSNTKRIYANDHTRIGLKIRIKAVASNSMPKDRYGNKLNSSQIKYRTCFDY